LLRRPVLALAAFGFRIFGGIRAVVIGGGRTALELVEGKEGVEGFLEGGFFILALRQHLRQRIAERHAVVEPDQPDDAAGIDRFRGRNADIGRTQRADEIAEDFGHGTAPLPRLHRFRHQRVDLAVDIVDVVLEFQQHVQGIADEIGVELTGMQQNERARPVDGFADGGELLQARASG